MAIATTTHITIGLVLYLSLEYRYIRKSIKAFTKKIRYVVNAAMTNLSGPSAFGKMPNIPIRNPIIHTSV